MDWTAIQGRLGVARDGQPGPITYAALITRLAGRAVPLAPALGAAMSVLVPRYEVDRPTRLPALLAQTAHESSLFRFLTELGGPSYCARYDGRADLGNDRPGDGYRYRGRGLIQLTGKSNYAEYGQALCLDLLAQPDKAAEPENAVLLALEFWRRKGLNALADKGLFGTITRRINGGTNGAADRLMLWQGAKVILL